MAEAPPTILAVDYFGAGATLVEQNSNTEEVKQFIMIPAANGNYSCSSEIDEGDTFMSEYRYCGGASPDIDTALGALITSFGDVHAAASGVQETMRVHFEAGEPATVTIDGHQHDGTQTHVIATLSLFDCSGIIPASSGKGVPELIAVTGVSSPVSADLEINANHQDKIGADGTHWHGQNVGPCRVSITVNYEGTVTAATAGSWLNIKVANSGDNQDTPTSTVTAEQFVDKS